MVAFSMGVLAKLFTHLYWFEATHLFNRRLVKISDGQPVASMVHWFDYIAIGAID